MQGTEGRAPPRARGLKRCVFAGLRGLVLSRPPRGRYLARFTLPGEEVPLLVLFEAGKEG